MSTLDSLSINDIYVIATGVLMGTLARVSTLKVDFRQIPTYPSAYFNNIVFGFIASALGAIAIPALLTRDFTAITFLTLAVSQFREVRTAERESLAALEHSEFAQRGDAYIDGIAKTFESRNYISLVTSVCTVFVIKIVNFPVLLYSILCGAAAGFLVMFFCYRFTKGKNVGEICDVHIGRMEVRGSELFVDDIFVTNYLGWDVTRALFETDGISVVLEPHDEASRVTLDNLGQRQAIMFEAVRSLGVRKYRFMELHIPSGKIIIAFVPIIHDPERLIKAVKNTPILENSHKVKRVMQTSLEASDE